MVEKWPELFLAPPKPIEQIGCWGFIFKFTVAEFWLAGALTELTTAQRKFPEVFPTPTTTHGRRTPFLLKEPTRMANVVGK